MDLPYTFIIEYSVEYHGNPNCSGNTNMLYSAGVLCPKEYGSCKPSGSLTTNYADKEQVKRNE